jgi:hypothetical protein
LAEPAGDEQPSEQVGRTPVADSWRMRSVPVGHHYRREVDTGFVGAAQHSQQHATRLRLTASAGQIVE